MQSFIEVLKLTHQTNGANEMTRCYVSESIAAHCNQPEEPECPLCYSVMSQDDRDLVCEDEECGHVIYAPDEDSY